MGEFDKRFKNFDAPKYDEMLEGVSRAYEAFNEAVEEARREFPVYGDGTYNYCFSPDIEKWVEKWFDKEEEVEK